MAETEALPLGGSSLEVPVGPTASPGAMVVMVVLLAAEAAEVAGAQEAAPAEPAGPGRGAPPAERPG